MRGRQRSREKIRAVVRGGFFMVSVKVRLIQRMRNAAVTTEHPEKLERVTFRF
jgi:hypothetical protein